MSFSTSSLINSKTGVLEKFSEFREILFELTKFRIIFAVCITTFVGYLVHNKGIDTNFILPTLGVLILAAGASALNEYQEKDLDSKMQRTKMRPIPSGRITDSAALFTSIILIIFGSTILSLHSFEVLILGLFTLVWYNGIYTPIKRKTSFAIIPGSLVGALPPVIGWVASGGNIWDYQILSFAAFMFIWQIPHFWLLVLMYDKQYIEAGFPTLSNIFSFDQIVKITFILIVLLLFSSVLFYFSELTNSFISNVFLFISAIITFYYSMKVLSERKSEIFKKTFLLINAYVLAILVIISIENIF